MGVDVSYGSSKGAIEINVLGVKLMDKEMLWFVEFSLAC